MDNQLKGTLYIGFPKSMTFNQAEALFDEVADYIDNNADVSMEILQGDKDYSQLKFQQEVPNYQDKADLFFMDMEILISSFLLKKSNLAVKEDNHTSFFNILSVNFEDVCEVLHNNGFIYNDAHHYWLKLDNDQ